MTTLPAVNAATTKNLRHLIASVISDQKSYNVPGVCRRYGLADGTPEEAFNSKYKYVIGRVQDLPSGEVFRVAKAVYRDDQNFELGEVLAKIDEAQQPHVSELTRRRIVTTLYGIPLSSNLPETEFLKKIWPINEMRAPHQSPERTMEDYILRHRVAHFDFDNRELLEALNIYECSQALFFHLLEVLTDPIVRDVPDQIDVVTRLNTHLSADGFSLQESSRISGAPKFKVRPVSHGGKTPADEEITRVLSAFNAAEIHERWQEALKRRASDPRAAITLARTLLEDVCKWLLTEAEEFFPDGEDLPALYKRLAAKLNLAPDQHTEKIFKQILGSCQSIVESLGAVRNKLGDAHSQGPKKARPQPRHAELAVNLAGTMATFLISTWEARQAEISKEASQGES